MNETVTCPFCSETVECTFTRFDNLSIKNGVVTFNVNYSTYTDHSCGSIPAV